VIVPLISFAYIFSGENRITSRSLREIYKFSRS